MESVSEQMRSLIGRVLVIQRRQDEWYEQVNSVSSVSIDDPVGSEGLLLELALETLVGFGGVVADPNRADYFYDLYEIMVLRDADIQGFIDVALGKRAAPEDAAL